MVFKGDPKNIEKIFKAYDVRGKVPSELDGEVAYAIGQAYAAYTQAKRVCVGYDIRLSREIISGQLIAGLNDAGVDVDVIGECGTEMVYFATFFYKLDGGIMVTASHNPADYNGLKFVREQAKPMSGELGLNDMANMLTQGKFEFKKLNGKKQTKAVMTDYSNYLLTLVNIEKMKPLRVVFNSGNGAAGKTLDALEMRLPIHMVKMFHEADGHFPNGVPNPLLKENRKVTSERVVQEKADLGVAFDGDFDRCFFFDEHGEYVDSYYIIGILAERFLKKFPGEKIIYDPRVIWNSIDLIQKAGGIPVQNKSGHAFMKDGMRKSNAPYGGEMSAHHFFRDFGFCDSGMLPWLVMLEILGEKNQSLSEMIGERKKQFPISGEINSTVKDATAVLAGLKKKYGAQALSIDEIDGLSMAFENFRFNVRASNTEPLLRLNVEARGDLSLLGKKTDEILQDIQRLGH